MFAGWAVSIGTPRAEKAGCQSLICGSSLIYAVGVVWFEPFLNVHELGELVVAAVVLLPLLLALDYLVRVRMWVAVAGVALFVTTCSAMITSNASVSDAGTGFRAWWTT